MSLDKGCVWQAIFNTDKKHVLSLPTDCSNKMLKKSFHGLFPSFGPQTVHPCTAPQFTKQKTRLLLCSMFRMLVCLKFVRTLPVSPGKLLKNAFSNSLLILLLFPSHTMGIESNPENPSQAIKPTDGFYRFTYEVLQLPQNENMGLLGVNYLILVNDNAYAGIGIYSAMTGERGGFFTGGLEAGMQFRLFSQTTIDGGIFVGGGGGGGAPQGGGLMLRPHAGLLHDLAPYRIGINASRVFFPNGDIDSTQVSLSLEKTFTVLVGQSWIDPTTSSNEQFNVTRFGLAKKIFGITLSSYFPEKGTRDTSGQVQDKRMDLIGIGLNQFLDPSRFLSFEVAGAAGGEIDGYAQVLLGAGYFYKIGRHKAIYGSLSLGSAGGGEVDTGGGAVVRLAIGYEHKLDQKWSVAANGNYLHAADGDLSAPGISLTGNYHFNSLSASPSTNIDLLTLSPKTRHWAIRVESQRYFPIGNNWRKTGGSTDTEIDSFGLAIETNLSPRIFVSGQTQGAYRGDAGGYATGLVGMGVRSADIFSYPINARAQLMIGAAGGGGLDVGGGLLTQTIIGLEFQPGKTWGLLVSGGRAEAPNGNFKANVASVALTYRFSTLEY